MTAQSSTPIGEFTKFPNEIIYEIGHMMNLQTIARFSQSCRFFRDMFSKDMRQLAAQHALPSTTAFQSVAQDELAILRRDDSFFYYNVAYNYLNPWIKEDPTRPIERMHDICLSGNADSLKFLLEAGVSPNANSVYAGPMITAAAVSGNLGCVKLLVKYGANVNPYSPAWSPLVFVPSDHHEMAKFLIESGCTVSVGTFWYICKMKDPVAVIQHAISHGKDIRSIRGHYGETVLHAAAAASHEKVLKFLLPLVPELINAKGGTFTQPLSALGIAAMVGNLKGALFLLKAGAGRDGVPADINLSALDVMTIDEIEKEDIDTQRRILNIGIHSSIEAID